MEAVLNIVTTGAIMEADQPITTNEQEQENGETPTQPQDSIIASGSRKIKRLKKPKNQYHDKWLAILSLAFSAFILLFAIMPSTISDQERRSWAKLFIVFPSFFLGILCVDFLVFDLINIKKYQLRFSKYTIMLIVGTIVTLFPMIFLAIYLGLAKLSHSTEMWQAFFS